MFSNISLLFWKHYQGSGDPVIYSTGYTKHTGTQTEGLCGVDVSAASLIYYRIVTK